MTPNRSFGRRVAIFGATSDVGFAVARRLAEDGGEIVLVGRDLSALQAAARDLKIRGAAQVHITPANFANAEELTSVVDAAWGALGGLDVALIAFGTLPDQQSAQTEMSVAEHALFINFVSPILLCNALAQRFAAQGSGTIAVITSVAGDRGRKSNFVYGAAKGGLQRYLQGLRHWLFDKHVRVLDIRPGLIATKMTAHMQQGGLLWSTPHHVANDIVASLRAGNDVLYTPWFWRVVMLGIRNLPGPVFHRTTL